MVAIVTRAGKGSPLTNAELDANFTNLNAGIAATPVGDVVGPAGATDNAIARFDTATGKVIQNSTLLVSDPGHLLPSADGTQNIGSPTLRFASVYSGAGVFTGPVSAGAGGAMLLTSGAANSILYFEQGAANAAILWDKAAKQFQFFGPAAQVFIDGAAGHITTSGNIVAGGTIQSAAAMYAPAFISQTGAGAAFSSAAGFGRLTFDSTNPTYLNYDTASKYLTYYIGPTLVMQLAPTGNMDLLGGLTATNGTFSSAVRALSVGAGPSGMVALGGQAGVNSVHYFDSITPGKLGAWVYQFPGNSLDLILGGTHVATFNPVGQSLNVDGAVTTARVFAKSATAGIGYAGLSPGGVSNTGYIDFFDAAATRAGFIGFADSTTKLIQVVGDGAYRFAFAQDFTFGANNDKPEPRGRYWNRPAPSGNYTLSPAVDQGALVVMVNAAPAIITIPPQSAGAWGTDARIDFVQWAGGTVTFAPGAGVSLTSAGGKRKIKEIAAGASLVQINPDDWWLVGDLIA
jgi:hypothetical protein